MFIEIQTHEAEALICLKGVSRIARMGKIIRVIYLNGSEDRFEFVNNEAASEAHRTTCKQVRDWENLLC